MTRSAGKLDEYKTYWRLAVKGETIEAERWLKRYEVQMSIWDDVPMVFPGFYRSKKGIPIAFWLELDDAGEIFVVMQTGRYKAQVEADLTTHGHISFVMTWMRCRHFAVTEKAYRYAVANYDEATGTYPWADRRLKEPVKRKDLRHSPSVF